MKSQKNLLLPEAHRKSGEPEVKAEEYTSLLNTGKSPLDTSTNLQELYSMLGIEYFNSYLRKTTAERLRLFRLARGFTQQEVAAAVGLSRSAYTKYESGRTPGLDTLRAICTVLDIPFFVMVAREEYPVPLKSTDSSEVPAYALSFAVAGGSIEPEHIAAKSPAAYQLSDEEADSSSGENQPYPPYPKKTCR